MTPDTSIQKTVLPVGEGSNGKSTYLSAVSAFIGERNVTAISLHKLEQDKYAAARLLGKLANICPDLPSAHLSSTSVFKAPTGGDVVCGEYKYRDSFEFVPFCKLVFSANQPPRSDDSTHGFFRRWAVVPFIRSFEDGEADTLPREVLDAQLSDPDELSGVLNKALAALLSIRRSGFTQSEATKKAWDEFRQATDPLTVWLDTNTTEDVESVTPKKALIQAYNAACIAGGRPTMTSTAFGLALRRARKSLGEGQRTVNCSLQWCYLGIRLDKDEQ